MPVLTWQQVAQPNFSGVAQSQATAAGSLNNAFGGLADAIGKYGQLQQNQAGAALLGNAAQHTDLASFQGAMADGSLLKGIDPSLVPMDAWKTLDAHAGNLINEATNQNNLDFNKATFGSRAALAAAQPAYTASQTSFNNASAADTAEKTKFNTGTESVRAAGLVADNASKWAGTNQAAQNTAKDAYGFNTDREANDLVQNALQAPDRQSALVILNRSVGSSDAKNRAQSVISSMPDSTWQTGQGPVVPGASVPNSAAPNITLGYRLPVGGVNGAINGAIAGAAPAVSGANTAKIGGTTPEQYGAALASGDVSAALRSSEGLRTDPYYDVNHWRTGYGSGTITNADGSHSAVGGANGSNPNIKPNVSITPAQAEADLQRRTNDFGKAAALAVGPAWGNFGAPTQAALTSMAYNYGHVPDNVVAAARTGDPRAIAQAIVQHAGDNGGANYARRITEAQTVLGSGAGSQPSSPGFNGGSATNPASAAIAIAAGAPTATTAPSAPAATTPTIAAPTAPGMPDQSKLPDFEADRQANIARSIAAQKATEAIRQRIGQNENVGIGSDILGNPTDTGDLNKNLDALSGTTKVTIKDPNDPTKTITTDSPAHFAGGDRMWLDEAAKSIYAEGARQHVQLSPDNVKGIIEKEYSAYTPNYFASWFTRPGARENNAGWFPWSGASQGVQDRIRAIGNGSNLESAQNTQEAKTLSDTISSLSKQKDELFSNYQNVYVNAQNGRNTPDQVKHARDQLAKVQDQLDSVLKRVSGAGKTDQNGRPIINTNPYAPLISNQTTENDPNGIGASFGAAIASSAKQPFAGRVTIRPMGN